MTIVGRDVQRETLTGLADRLSAGRGGGVLVTGPPGCGITSFLLWWREAGDLPVIEAAGRHGESHIDGAVLRELASAEPTARLAHRIADLETEGLADALLDWAGTVGPTIVSVDDIDLADDASRDALGFTARRLHNLPLLLVLASHGDDDGLEDLVRVEIGPLATDLLAPVVAERHGLSTDVAESVAVAADGVPLVAFELARALTPDQRDGSTPLPDSLLTHVSIPHVFSRPTQALDDATRRALCVAAAEPAGELRTIAMALTVLGDDIAALEPAEENGIVTIRDGAVRFDHPLRRNAAYHLLAAPSRRAAHRALASALTAPADAERRALQLTLGVVEPDESVARDLELVAVVAARRGDRRGARRWWRRSADLTPDPVDAERRRRLADDANTDPLEALTAAERRVAAVVGRGMSNKATAAELFVSVKTVDAHLQSIYRKLGLGSRTELALLVANGPDPASLADAAGGGVP